MTMKFRYSKRKAVVVMLNWISYFFQLLHPTSGFLDTSLVTSSMTTPLKAGMRNLHMASYRDEDNGNAQTIPNCRSLRRKIPYVECYEEQIARELWERNPFCSVANVVGAVIASGSRTAKKQAILTPIQPSVTTSNKYNENSETFSGYEDSFDLLYKQPSADSEFNDIGATSGNTDIVGTASIKNSPFVFIPDAEEMRKEKLNHFCLRVAYRGDFFCGWQTQLDNFEKPSVQRTLEEWLTELQNDRPIDAKKEVEMKKLRRKEKGKRMAGTETNHPVQNRKTRDSLRIKWADLPVAGRTDSGVSAVGQLCRFRTYRKDLTSGKIEEYLSDRIMSTPGMSQSLCVTEITRVSKAFHPTFTTCARAYAYLIDIGSNRISSSQTVERDGLSHSSTLSTFNMLVEEKAEEQVILLNSMLRKLEGKKLDYNGLSYGKVTTSNTFCTLYHARAQLVEYEYNENSSATADEQQLRRKRAVCVELVGDRFLRRMVRLLIEASVRLVAIAFANNEKSEDALIELIQKNDRKLVGRPAPPDGLIFVGARVQSK